MSGTFLTRLLPPALPLTDKQKPTVVVFVLFVLRLALVGFLLTLYNIESGTGLNLLVPFIAGGALLHFFLPLRFRPLLFTLVCIVCIVFAIGWISGGLLCAAILFMLGIAHLKINYTLRVLLLLGITAGLTLLRLQIVHAPRLIIITPLIGSMLMFRFILYMHELKHEKNAPSWTERLSYFFNPVNIGLPLFPVLDYKTWLRARTPEAFAPVYDTAFRRIIFGLACLLLYRLLYLRVTPITEIQTAGDLLGFTLLGYTLVLRMIGMLWIAIGLIGIYGYELPPVFDQVFLAERVSEIWRRINIYWRDFVTKVFYYPAYFRLRKKTKHAVLLSTLFAFVATWFLHNWQWFWLRGDFHFSWNDLAYWLILGTLIAVAISREADQPARKKTAGSLRESFFTLLRITKMYLLMSVLWTLWNSISIGDWLFLLGKITHDPLSLRWYVIGIVLFIGIGTLVHRLLTHPQFGKSFAVIRNPFLVFCAGVALLALALLPAMYPGSTQLATRIHELTHPQLNQQDRENAEQGYYENLVDAGTGTPWEQSIRTRGRGQWFSGSEQAAPDIRKRTLKPNFSVREGNKTFTTNRWGMRSPECDTVKKENVYRIAFIGSSYEMGSGVSDEEVFARVFEKMLNDSLQKTGKPVRVEVLNFSVGGYSWPQYVWLCEHEVFKFHPDHIFVFSHSEEKQRVNGVIARLIQNGLDLEYEELKLIKNKAGAKQSMSRSSIQNLLYPYDYQLLDFGYSRVKKAADAHHVPATWVYVPALNRPAPAGEYEYLQQLAAKNRFERISLVGAYAGYDEAALQLTPADHHPDARGHYLLGKKLADAFFPEIGSRK